jgi:hypothetical protein
MRTALVALACLVVLAIVLPFQGCGDNDNSVALPCCPVCGDGVCSGDEGPCNCGLDCNQPSTVCTQIVHDCGDGVCSANGSPGESHERCPADCALACRQCGAFEVVARGRSFRGDACPPGTTEAYRDGHFLACDSCADARDCQDGEACVTRCGPGCEHDSGGCCPLRECAAPLQ